MSGNQIILNYKGPVDADTTEMLLQKLKNDLASHRIEKVLRKRIYTIMVECIENILRHKAAAIETSAQPYIRLEKDSSTYRITSGNAILNTDVRLIKEKLRKIVGSDREQLHKMYEDQINTEADVTKKGAGLGLIIIAQKTSYPLHYEFIALNEQLSVFELQVTIPIDHTK